MATLVGSVDVILFALFCFFFTRLSSINKPNKTINNDFVGPLAHSHWQKNVGHFLFSPIFFPNAGQLSTWLSVHELSSWCYVVQIMVVQCLIMWRQLPLLSGNFYCASLTITMPAWLSPCWVDSLRLPDCRYTCLTIAYDSLTIVVLARLLLGKPLLLKPPKHHLNWFKTVWQLSLSPLSNV